MISAGPTLLDLLADLGLTTRPTQVPGVREVLDSAGRVVFRGRAREAWEWLDEGRPEVSDG